MRIIMTQEREVMTIGGSFQLIYELLMNYEEAIRLFLLFVRETVMPVHLYELIDDWQSAFRSGIWELISKIN